MPATTIAWNVSFGPADCAGHLIVAVRFPLNAIHVPAYAPEHGTIAVDFQQRTTRVPSRTCSRAFAGTGLPA